MIINQTALTQLPPLRQELSLTPNSPNQQGEPTWILHDPTNNRFFQLGWAAFEMLSRWRLRDPQTLLTAIAQETTLKLSMSDIESLVQFLAQQHLLLAYTPEDSARMTRYAEAIQAKDTRWLLKNYLFFRLPLVRPKRFLEALAPHFEQVFKPRFWWAVAALLALGIFLISRQWDSFTHTFAAYMGLQGLLGVGIALSFAKILHECGHALTAHKYGCRVPTMGIAFLVMMPVLYTDTTDAWKLSSRKQRMHIGAAGMLAELVLAVIATLAWSFMPDGPLRAGAFLLATSTWVITLAINASPFMRFDGYFLLADWLNLPNLHERAFALGRWWLREKLFGWGDPVPEQFPSRRHGFLIAFAFATAIYRAILFIGIAVIVYHFFFKLLGIFLMLVELGWFIAYPVKREIQIWWQRRDHMQWNLQTKRSAGISAALIILLILPWQTSIRAPAVIGAEQAQGLYAVSAAKVTGTVIREGEQVKAGQVLVQLESPDLAFNLALAQTKERALRWQLEQQSLNSNLQLAGPALQKRWEGAAERVRGLEERIQQLTITAPFDGIVNERNPTLTQGTWVAAGEKLFYVINPKGIKGEAYLTESDMLRSTGTTQLSSSTAHFIAQQTPLGSVNCSIEDIDKLNIHQLDQAYLANHYGGSIATQITQEGHLIPLEATFRLRLYNCQNKAEKITQELAGVAHLHGERKSFLVRGLTEVTAVLRRESGV